MSFNWAANAESSPPQPAIHASEPPSVWLSARDMKLYGATPDYQPGLIKCIECDKVVLRPFASEHLANCRTIRAKKKGGKLTEADASKKRKTSPTEDPSLPAKKKLKLVAPPSRRHKGPVDYDKHCGVINDKGLPCSRSLTCKSHSMGAKRAVLGRSRKYDDLLLQWNRENNPNFVEPVKRESKAERKEKKEKEKAEKKRLAEEAAAAAGIDLNAINKKTSSANPGAGPNASSSSHKKTKKAAAAAAAVKGVVEDLVEETPENLDNIDSEAELEDMVASLKAAAQKGSIGVPLAIPCDASSWFVQRREKVRCCRDLLLGALGGAPAGSTLIPMARSSSITARLG